MRAIDMAVSNLLLSPRFLLIGCLAVLLGCQAPESVTPVATPAVGLNRVAVPLGGPVEMTYRFTPAVDGLGESEDYRVFVHFLTDSGEMMFTDDHSPPVPTTEWQAGREVVYERRVLVPIYPFVGQATVALGFYSEEDGERLPLAAEDLGQREYAVATLRMAPQSESGFLSFGEGWHDRESTPEDVTREWQWTTGRSTISFQNPRTASTLSLELNGRPGMVSAPQVLTLMVGDTSVATLELASEESTFYSFELSTDTLGDEEMVELVFDVDRTFVPAEVSGGENGDRRELGVQLHYAFLESQ